MSRKKGFRDAAAITLAASKEKPQPIFYKKRSYAYKGVFYALVVVTTMITAGVFYYG